MIPRLQQQQIENRLFDGKTILLLGPRQVGKTTLIKEIAKKFPEKTKFLNGDDTLDRDLLNGISGARAKQLFPAGSLIIIDEAQRLTNTGLTLKILHDNCEGVQFIATGSSSFALSDKIKEAMTGRKWTYHLFPISFQEIKAHFGMLDAARSLETRLVFGSYPEVINRPGMEAEVLQELSSDYLYKDVFSIKELRKPEAFENLVKALALQVGNQVSFRELAGLVGIDKETVERYIYLLEEAFIIFRLPSFARNLRNELKRSRKIYFWDNGIRNAVIGQFSELVSRNDVGPLWENYLISERMKRDHYQKNIKNYYFWRTTAQKEIDLIEEHSGKLFAFEFKWNPRKTNKFPTSFQNAYPQSETQIIARENYMDFLVDG